MYSALQQKCHLKIPYISFTAGIPGIPQGALNEVLIEDPMLYSALQQVNHPSRCP